MSDGSPAQKPVWLRGHQVRVRLAGMAHSTFYAKLKARQIPAPEYPFGPRMPLWRLSVIEEFEQRPTQKVAA